jgi:hypothetical protein
VISSVYIGVGTGLVGDIVSIYRSGYRMWPKEKLQKDKKSLKIPKG